MKRRIPTFDELKFRHQLREEAIHNSAGKELDQAHGEVAHQDAGELIKTVQALMDVTKPNPTMKDKQPLVLYFGSDEEREGFMDAYKKVNPNSRMVKVP